MRSDAERLGDIVEAIERIQSRVKIERLQEDDMLQVWVLYHLQIVGEVVRSLAADVAFHSSFPPFTSDWVGCTVWAIADSKQ